jgi:hypothetical protein
MCNTYKDKSKYDERHGGAFDRGRADSYYHRPRKPHFFMGNTYSSLEVTEENMNQYEKESYHAGYEWNEKFGDKKDWN